MRNSLKVAGWLCAAVLTAGLPSVGYAAGGQDADKVKKGEEVYTAQKCSMCHQIAGKGNKLSPLDGVGAKRSAEDLKGWIMDPAAMTQKTQSTKKPAMPNKYSKLPAADVDALVAYLQSLK